MARTTTPDPSQIQQLLDIAHEVREASDELDDQEKAQALAFYRECRGLVAPDAPKAGLRLLLKDFLVEWNEGAGPDVEAFWQRVLAAGLPVTRQHDIVAETLSRGRVANMNDYIELEDHFEGLQACGKLDRTQAEALAQMLDAFAEAPENQKYFEGADDEEPEDEERAEEEEAAQDDEDAEHGSAGLQVPIGQLVRVSTHEWRFDYFGREVTDWLQQRGLQGGGETWAGLVQALLELHQTSLLPAIRLDPEADCLAVWSSDPEALRAVAHWIAQAVTDRPTLERALAHATEAGGLE